MVEVVHNYNGSYPFGKKKESENTFLELVKENLNEEQISLLKSMSKVYKSISCPRFIKLLRILRENSNLYFIYEYQETSLQDYLNQVKKSLDEPLSKEKYKSLLVDFKSNIDYILDVLIKKQIKADIFLSNLGYIPTKDSFLIKTFIDMEAEYLSLIEHEYKAKDNKKKDRSECNQQYLLQFYEAERKRLMLDFEELLQKKFGKFQDPAEKKHFPNFVIQGTKLVFVPNEEKEKDNSGQNGRTLEQVRSVEQKQMGLNKQLKNRQSFEHKHKLEIQSTKKSPQAPIIDFDQSFEPEFKPEQFLKEKTYIYEENDYLDSLEEELCKLAVEKKVVEIKRQEVVLKENSKEGSQEKGKEKVIDKMIDKVLEKEQKAKTKDLTVSEGSTKCNPNNESNNNSNGNNSSNNDSYEKKQELKEKIEKINKYKMKIITSHQIQIESGKEPNTQELQKQILEGIKSGKININQINNHPKCTVMNKQQYDQYARNSAANIRTVKEEQKDNNIEKMYHSEDVRGEYLENELNNLKNSKDPNIKMKSINEIIEKLGKRSKEQATQNKPGSGQGQVSYTQPKKIPSFESSTTPQHKTDKTQMTQAQNQNTQKYLMKIKEAKNKAEQVLRQYTKKKQ